MQRNTRILSLTCFIFTAQLFSNSIFASQGTIYGRANVTLQTDKSGEHFNQFKSNGSRLGIIGDFELTDDFSLIYQYAIQPDFAFQNDEKDIKKRNQYIGISGKFGRIIYGRNDTVLKLTQGKIDQFNDYTADLKHLWQGDNRIKNSLTYKTNRYNELSFGLTYVNDQQQHTGSGYSAALIYGDLNLERTVVYAKVAIDNNIKGYDITRAVSHIRFVKFKLGLGLQQQQSINGGAEQSGYLVKLQYPFGNTHLKLQYQTLDDDNTVSIGADYRFNKNFKLTAWYSALDHSSTNSQEKNQNYLSVGFEYKFKSQWY